MCKKILFLLLFFIFTLNGCTAKNKRVNNVLDLNGDGVSELLFWNFTSRDSFFESVTVQGLNYEVTKLGSVGDIPVFGDFTGDGNADFGIFQNLEGVNRWYLVDGLTKISFSESFGNVGDLPVPADFDGDKKTDFVVYRPSNSGFYGVLSDKSKILEMHFGLPGDVPVPKDYDGDGKADIATYRVQSGVWSVRYSRNGTVRKIDLGGPDYYPIPSDYDGDGKTDPAVWNYKTNDCKVIFSSVLRSCFSRLSLNEISQKLGNKKCFPVLSDFDGDGKSEFAFWDYNNHTAHVFKISGTKLSHQEFFISLKRNSKPVSYYLLEKFFHNEKMVSPSCVRYNGFPGLVLGKNGEFNCQGCLVNNKLNIDPEDNLSYFLSDFDGDFILDPCVWSPKVGAFLIFLSRDKLQIKIPMGSGSDLPLIGHFNSDDITDVATFMISDNSFSIKYLGSDFKDYSTETVSVNAGEVSRVVAGDFDGDFVDDLGVYSSLTKTFIVRLSSSARQEEIPFIVKLDELVVSDFDGDGKSDLATVDVPNKFFTYLSSTSNKLVNVALDSKINGNPFAADFDLDFMSDLLFHNGSIFGVLRSSDAYRYDEVLFGERDSKLVNLVR